MNESPHPAFETLVILAFINVIKGFGCCSAPSDSCTSPTDVDWFFQNKTVDRSAYFLASNVKCNFYTFSGGKSQLPPPSPCVWFSGGSAKHVQGKSK